MHVFILLAFVVARTLAEDLPDLGVRSLVAPVAAAYLAGAAAVAALRTALSLRAMQRRPGFLPGAFRLHRILTIAAQAWLLGGLAGLVAVGYGRWVLHDLRLARVPLLGELMLVGPFLVALILHWVLEYPLYRAVRLRIARHAPAVGAAARTGWSFREFLDFNIRHNLLFVAVPVALIVLLTDLVLLGYDLWPPGWGETGTLLASLACAVGVLLVAPLLIVRIWRTAQLPPGPLRDRLTDLCRRLRLTARGLRVWQSAGMVANAAVVGLFGPVRYILLSDALLENLSEEEVRSIFAHEAGHIVGHHVFYSLLFAVCSVTVCSLAAETLADWTHLEWWVGQVLAVAMLAGAWAFGFGWISRRFERQSDVTAAWLSGPGEPDGEGRISPHGAAVFAHALQAVAQLNGINELQRNWRHGSIASRIDYVLRLGAGGGTRGAIDRTVRRIKAGLWLTTAAAAGMLALRVGSGG